MRFKEAFLQWAEDWHGNHDQEWAKEVYETEDTSEIDELECSVRKQLNRYEEGKASFDDVVKAVMETDDGWVESFENFLEQEV